MFYFLINSHAISFSMCTLVRYTTLKAEDKIWTVGCMTLKLLSFYFCKNQLAIILLTWVD